MKPLKQIDEHIRQVFSEKLGELESPVPNELWNAVQAKISVGTAANTAVVAGSKGIAAVIKIVAAAVVVAGVAVAVIMNQSSDETGVVAQKEITQPIKDQQKPVENLSTIQENVVTPSTEEAENIKSLIQEPQVGEFKSSEEIQDSQENSKNVYERDGDEVMPMEQPGSVQHQGLTNKREDQSPGLEKAEHADAESAREQSILHISSAFEVRKENNHQLTVSFHPESHGEFSYEWSFGDGNQSEAISPSHTYDAEGEYLIVLRITDKNQRVITSEQTIQVYKPGAVVIPNVFTPNGDGSNDIFDPSVLSQAVDFDKVVVFNMAGVKVFESHGDSFWDGKDPSGTPCEPGQYQYIISAHDRNHEILEKKGYVTLIR